MNHNAFMTRILLLLLVFFAALCSQAHVFEKGTYRTNGVDVEHPISIELYPLSEVRLGNAPEFTSRVAACRQYLLTLKADRLLAPFRREAGLSPLAESYGNWESSGLDGHMLGHCLSACANLIAAGHDEDGELRRMLDTLVDGLAVCQAARGCFWWKLLRRTFSRSEGLCFDDVARGAGSRNLQYAQHAASDREAFLS